MNIKELSSNILTLAAFCGLLWLLVTCVCWLAGAAPVLLLALVALDVTVGLPVAARMGDV